MRFVLLFILIYFVGSLILGVGDWVFFVGFFYCNFFMVRVMWYLLMGGFYGVDMSGVRLIC